MCRLRVLAAMLIGTYSVRASKIVWYSGRWGIDQSDKWAEGVIDRKLWVYEASNDTPGTSGMRRIPRARYDRQSSH
jgi:hypothetical protein